MKQKVNTQVLIKNFGVIFVLLLSFWAIKPLFVSGFFPMHDDTQVARVFEMGKALKDGMLPVRWVPDLGYGYGYPIFNFYAPLAYYVGGVFVLLGFDALVATKIMMVLGVVLSGIFMYLLAREFWGELGGIISGLFYVYAPYHALDIYVRGDVAEFWAYAFIPLMFFGFYRVFKKSQDSDGYTAASSKFNPFGKLRTRVQSSKLQLKIQNGVWKWAVMGSLGYAGVILSHNLTAMMVTPFLIIVTLLYCYIAYKKTRKLHTTYYLILTAVLGLVISAFYWVPALLEMKYTNVLSQIGGGADFRDHFVCASQLWESNWGFGGSAPGCMPDGISFVIGKLHIFSFVVSVALFMLTLLRVITGYYEKIKEKMPVVIISIFGFLISVFLMLEVSKPIWESIPAMAFFQYPWRFLLLTAFLSSFIAGGSMCFLNIHLGGALPPLAHWLRWTSRSPPRWAILIAGFVVLLSLLIYPNSKLFQPQTVFSKTSLDYTNDIALKWTASKISDEYMPRDFVKPSNPDEIPNALIVPDLGSSKIVYESLKTQSINGVLSLSENTNFLIKIAYFPAWKVFLDGKETSFRPLNNGLLVYISKDQHGLELKFQETLIEKISNLTSLFGIVVIIVAIIKFRRRLMVNE